MKPRVHFLLTSLGLFCILGCLSDTFGQTTAFSYQGKLTDAGNPANGNYDMQFKLFDAVSGGTQQGATITNGAVVVSVGIFTVNLDFGANALNGAARYLEIGVRSAGSGNAYTLLSPRQAILATPYAIKSLMAENTLSLGGTAASQYVLTTDGRMTDSRDPLPNSTNYIQNKTTTQTAANFKIDGAGSADILNVLSEYRMRDGTILNAPGVNNLFVGFSSGLANAGSSNSFFGIEAGLANTAGSRNSYFGHGAGRTNTLGLDNAFFGAQAGLNTNGSGNLNSGSQNAFFGSQAGLANTSGKNNVFIGYGAGSANTNQVSNVMIGSFAGLANTASGNTFTGAASGLANTTGVANSFFGQGAGAANVTGSNQSFFGSQAGANNVSGGNNSFFGAEAGFSTTTGIENDFFGYRAGYSNTAGGYNTFFGKESGYSNTQGGYNSFFGNLAGFSNTTGDENSFFGFHAGYFNSTGHSNSFFGRSAGRLNTTGYGNSFFGRHAGLSNGDSINNSFFGYNAGVNISTGGSHNSFFGAEAGIINGSGHHNNFFGYQAGYATTSGSFNNFFGFHAALSNTTGSYNSFFGEIAGFSNTTGDHNSALGYGARMTIGDLSYATAVGANAQVAASNQVQLGRNGLDTVSIGALTSASGLHVCLNGTVLSSCSSSRRYKENIQPFRGGLKLLSQLRPVSFAWKERHDPDLGLIAEEVAEIEPLLVTHNSQGEIEGVKYEQLNIVLINALNEQQAQIQKLMATNAALQARLRTVEVILHRKRNR